MRLLLLCLAALCGTFCNAQLLTWTPPFPKEADPSQTLVITVDATKGNAGLLNYTPASDVYVHIGVVTSTSNGGWSHVPFTWATTPAAAQATYVGNNKWTFTITGSLRTFFGVTDPAETIRKIAILFRSGNGNRKQANSDNSDMYIPVYDNTLAVRVEQPATEPRFVPVAETQTWAIGSSFPLLARSNTAADLKIYHNGTVVASATNAQSVSGNSTVTAYGNQQIVAEATSGTVVKRDTVIVFVAPPSSPVAPLPSGVRDGINYEPGDTSVTLVLRAPGKNLALVVGDFNNWSPSTQHIMNKTADGKFFWIRIQSLTPGTEYAYQYVVDNNIRIADPYAEKVLDPQNDPFIPATTYPNLKPYPAGQTGIVSVLQTAQPAYTWAVPGFVRPDKRSLVIYELLLRDFVAAHDWKTVKDTLSYLKRLGVNAIEVMPFNEFQGNISWGYDPYQYFAPDKYYGPKNTLKQFVDSCHKNGIAVYMDIVLNHTYGPSPLAQLYWDAANNRPAANNPWYNPVQPHAFGFGSDFNHESADTRYFFGRVLQHWLTEYKIDGYRFDFSKGLTQKPSNSDASFSAYDASRIANIMNYYNAVKSVDAGANIILEHFCDNTEEKQLADSGLLLWASVYTQFQEAAMGYLPNSNFEGSIYSARGWTRPHVVAYMESHDEERIMYKNLKYGNSSGSYNVRDTTTALKRVELDAAFMLAVPGPKMIWEFGELGYDISRCYQSTNGDGGDCDKKLDPKPIRWDYKNDPRRQHVFELYSSMNRLRFHPWYREAFLSGTVDRSLAGALKWLKVASGDSSQLVVVGNFDVNSVSGTVSFPVAGTWYDYLQNTTFSATGGAQTFNLQPGEFHVYVNRNVNNLPATPVTDLPWNGATFEARLYPNPAAARFTTELRLPQSGVVTVSLYNTLGQYVKTVQRGFLAKGVQQVNVDPSGLSAGTYFLKIETKTATKTISVTIQ